VIIFTTTINIIIIIIIIMQYKANINVNIMSNLMRTDRMAKGHIPEMLHRRNNIKG